MAKREIQTNLVGRIAVLGCKINDATRGAVVVHDVNYVWANREGEIVTVYQDHDKNVRYTVNIDGRLIDLYSNEFTIKS